MISVHFHVRAKRHTLAHLIGTTYGISRFSWNYGVRAWSAMYMSMAAGHGKPVLWTRSVIEAELFDQLGREIT